jgi:hypothetical protein
LLYGSEIWTLAQKKATDKVAGGQSLNPSLGSNFCLKIYEM